MKFRGGVIMFKRIISVLLVSMLLVVPVWAQEDQEYQDEFQNGYQEIQDEYELQDEYQDPHRIPYLVAVRGATRNVASVTALDTTIADLQELRQGLQDLREHMRRTGTHNRYEILQLDRQIGDLSANINSMRISQEMARISTEFSMRNTMTTIANTQLDIQLLESTLEHDRTNLHIAQLRFDAGLISESDLRALDLNVQQRESNLAALQVTLATEQQSLNRILQRSLTGYYYVYHNRELIELPANMDNHIRNTVGRQPNVRQRYIARGRARAVLNLGDAPFGSPARQERERNYNQATREYNEARRNVESALRNQYNTLTMLLQQNESLAIDLQRANERLETVTLNYQAGLATPFDVEAARLGILNAELSIERNLNTFWNAQFMFEHPFLLLFGS